MEANEVLPLSCEAESNNQSQESRNVIASIGSPFENLARLSRVNVHCNPSSDISTAWAIAATGCAVFGSNAYSPSNKPSRTRMEVASVASTGLR